MKRIYYLLPLLCYFGVCPVHLLAQTKPNTSKWEAEIRTFEKSDLTNPPPKGAILFVGSSSIRKWSSLPKDFPGKTVINRGFGGSEIADSTAFAERIIFPYEPKMIVLYAGDNDLAAGKSVKQVVADYHDFVQKVHARLPETRLAFISIKPCPLRWRLKEKVQAVNQQIAAMKGDRLVFIDVYPSMLDADGKPQADLFLSDGLHPSAKCYRLWASLIKPWLED
jgi:lysophospholipase L1-like esterase